MKHNKYNELNSKKEKLREVSITDEQAKRFNAKSKESGLTYVPIKQDKTK